MLTLAKPQPNPVAHPMPRKHHCACGRYLGESTAAAGYIVVKCPKCGKWRRLDFCA